MTSHVGGLSLLFLEIPMFDLPQAFRAEIDWSTTMKPLATLFDLPSAGKASIPTFNNKEFLPQKSDDYHFDEEQTKAVLSYLFAGLNGDGLLIHGPFGSGKTSLLREVLARLGWPTLMLSWNESSDTADLVGKMDIQFGDTVFSPGPLTIAARMGYALVINEIDRGRAGNLVALNDILDGGNLVIKETGEVIKPHPNFRLICTANSAGGGDLTGQYTGSVRKLDPAFLNRFLMIKVGYMPTLAELDVMLRRFPQFAQVSSVFVQRMCDFATVTRTNAEDPAEILSSPLTTRGLNRFFAIGLTMGIPGKLANGSESFTDTAMPALKLAYFNSLSPEEAEAATAMFSMSMGN